MEGGSCNFGDAALVGFICHNALLCALVLQLVDVVLWMPSSLMVTIYSVVGVIQNRTTVFDSSFGLGLIARRAAGFSSI